MKTVGKMTKIIVGAAREPGLGDPHNPPLPARDKRSLIQWTSEQQIQDVSKRLATIQQAAIRSEVKGDYSRSGDLAYQIREIVQATAELFRKSQRVAG